MVTKIKCIVMLLLLVINTSCNSVEKSAKYEFFAVTKIVDGDTFYIETGEKIRLIGVDTPETRRSKRKPVGYYGKEAKAYVTKLLEGKRVRLEYDVGRFDRYRRTLAYVYLEDGTFLNALLVKEGYANVMTVPPNVKYAEEFVKLEREARENNRGLWKKKGY